MNRVGLYWAFTVLLGLLALRSASAATHPELLAILHSDSTIDYFGHRILPMGDQNDDGFDDFLVSGGRSVFLFYGGDPLDTNFVLQIDSVRDLSANMGDVNGNGFDDIALRIYLSGVWSMNLYFGGPSMDTVRDLWFGVDSLTPVGLPILVHDLNGNGNPMLVAKEMSSNRIAFFELGTDKDSVPDMTLWPANFDPDSSYAGFGGRIIAGDFNGDGADDLGVQFRPESDRKESGSIYFYWGGDMFDTLPDLVIRRPGEYDYGREAFGQILEPLGDLNGDGFDDFIVASAFVYDLEGFVYFGGPLIDTLPDVHITEEFWSSRLAGDINGDGYNDLITGNPGGGYVNVYFGGIAMDSIPDIHFVGAQTGFGWDCSGVGDVNGDGIDDFAFSSIGQDRVGVVFVYSGPGPSTDVEDNTRILLPEQFELYQNYPNPFNPSTTIEFNMPVSGHAQVTVHNVLGQRIATILDRQLSRGAHTVTWDGKTADGAPAASGIYFFTLRSGEFTATRRGLLLK